MKRNGDNCNCCDNNNRVPFSGKMNLSFAGCGFLGIYHVGVAVCFRKYAPHLLLNKISGASAGAIAACCLLCDLPLGDFTSDVLRVSTEARSRSLGPFNPSFNIQNILLEGMEKVLPDDAHLRVNGKLHISLTRVCDGKNVIVSHFDSREDLMNALLASAFIPLFSGLIPPKFHGVRYMDGGFSDNLPTLDENTITVSPFCGESDICPRDDSSQLFHINVANTSIEVSKHNMYRIARILFPPKPEILSNMCKQGFDDALRFLHRNNLINCTRCLAVQSTFIVSNVSEDNCEYDPQCNECKMHRQEALVSNMPDTVLSIFQEAIDSANKGLLNWVFKHRGMKLLSVLTLPYTLPADMVYATFTKLKGLPVIKPNPSIMYSRLTDYSITSIIGNTIETRSFQYNALGNIFMSPDQTYQHVLVNPRFLAAAPKMTGSLLELSRFFVDQMSHVLHKVNSRRQQLTAKISCQLAITEYGGEVFDVESCQDKHLAKNKVNLNFTLNLDDSDLPISQSPARKFSATKVLSRRPSLTTAITKADANPDDTFDNILQVTSHHDAIMAYYYLDEHNKVKVTEIFDVTDSDLATVQTSQERELNKQLEFDDDWDECTWTTQDPINKECQYLSDRRNSLAASEYSLEDILDKDTSNLFSDPESEWQGTFRVDEPEEDETTLTDLRPESDQLEKNSECMKSYKIPSYNVLQYDS